MATTETRKRVRDRSWLEKARRLKGKSQSEVAEVAGCSEVFYNRIEKGLQLPNVDLAIRITDFLDCDIHSFISEKILGDN